MKQVEWLPGWLCFYDPGVNVMKIAGINCGSFIASFAFYVVISTPVLASSQYALLVGVTDYPSLSDEQQLHGPGNDVDLLERLLRERGFDRKNVNVLTNKRGESAQPTHKAILDALHTLTEVLQRDDFVYLHFSGHGSQQPAAMGQLNHETDGLDEIFLPTDIGQWSDDGAQVENAITDNEMNHVITMMRNKGAFVWAVFDSCHSGTMTRGNPQPGVRYRKVSPKLLGIPAARLKAAAVRHQGRVDELQTEQKPGDEGAGGYIGFFASQTTETTPEMVLPRGHERRKPYGLFSYTLAEILQSGASMSYRQAGQLILQRYMSQNMRMATPMFEGGDYLDAPLFGMHGSRERILQWPLDLADGRWTIPAGALQQVERGSLFAILPDAAAGNDQLLGYAVVKESTEFTSTLEPREDGEQHALAGGKPDNKRYARLLEPAISMVMRIALPSEPASYGGGDAEVYELLQRMSHKENTQGISIEWVDDDQEADLRLAIMDNQLWLLSATGELIQDGADKSLSVRFDRPADELEEVLSDSFQSIAKVLNLLKIANSVENGKYSAKIEMVLLQTPVASGGARAVESGRITEFREGDKIRFILKNHSSTAVDVTLLFIDSQYGVTAMYPLSGQSNRIGAGDLLSGAEFSVTADTLGIEHMLVIAVKALPGTAQSDFSYLGQQRLQKTKGVAKTRGIGANNVYALLKRAGFGGAATRGLRPKKSVADETVMKVYSWRVMP